MAKPKCVALPQLPVVQVSGPKREKKPKVLLLAGDGNLLSVIAVLVCHHWIFGHRHRC